MAAVSPLHLDGGGQQPQQCMEADFGKSRRGKWL